MPSLDFLTYFEPLITIVALFFTAINWIISQRLNSFNKRFELLEESFKSYQEHNTKEIESINNKINKIYHFYTKSFSRFRK